jgi:hypothetical protein
LSEKATLIIDDFPLQIVPQIGIVSDFQFVNSDHLVLCLPLFQSKPQTGTVSAITLNKKMEYPVFIGFGIES